MSEASEILQAAAQGDPQAASQLLPLVYDELRRLAAQRLAQEPPGQTLDATGLVHEAYLRLIGPDSQYPWNGRGHFFMAAAEAMRRILIDNARHKQRMCHGGDKKRISLEAAQPADARSDDKLLAVNDALDQLAQEDEQVVQVVKLRYFVGMTIAQTADVLGISVRTANRHWSYARAWLYRRLS